MKRILVPTVLLCSALLALGQGTVQFSNPALYRISTDWVADGLGYLSAPVPTTPGLITYGLFYGLGQSTSLTLLTSQMGANSTVTAGVIASSTDSSTFLGTVPIPGTQSNESDVWVQFAGWSAAYGTNYVAAHMAFVSGGTAAYWGTSRIVNVQALGPTSGPGVLIWTSSTGTNPQYLQAFTIFFIPEPSALALAGLAAFVLVARKRRQDDF